MLITHNRLCKNLRQIADEVIMWGTSGHWLFNTKQKDHRHSLKSQMDESRDLEKTSVSTLKVMTISLTSVSLFILS